MASGKRIPGGVWPSLMVSVLVCVAWSRFADDLPAEVRRGIVAACNAIQEFSGMLQNDGIVGFEPDTPLHQTCFAP